MIGIKHIKNQVLFSCFTDATFSLGMQREAQACMVFCKEACDRVLGIKRGDLGDFALVVVYHFSAALRLAYHLSAVLIAP